MIQRGHSTYVDCLQPYVPVQGSSVRFAPHTLPLHSVSTTHNTQLTCWLFTTITPCICLPYLLWNIFISFQANSYFNLQKPFDLVEFIHQEQRLNQMNVLQDDLKQEKQILQQVQEQEKSDVTETFFKTDSSCKTLKKRLHDMDLNLNHVISFNSKGIK